MDNKTIHLDDLIGDDKDKQEVTNIKKDDKKDLAIKKKKSAIVTPKTTGAAANLEKAKPAAIGDIRKFTPKIDPEKEYIDKELQLIDKRIEETKVDMTKRLLDPLKEKCMEIADEKELAESEDEKKKEKDLANIDEEMGTDLDDDINSSINEIDAGTSDDDEEDEDVEEEPDEEEETRKKNIKKMTRTEKEKTEEADITKANTVELDPQDFEDVENQVKKTMDDDTEEDEAEINGDDDNTEAAETPEEEAKRKEAEAEYKRQNAIVADTIGNSAIHKIDLKSFKVGQDAITINKSLKFIKAHNNSNGQAAFPLYNTGRRITMTALSGSELAMLASDITVNTQEAIMRTLGCWFKHDVSVGKPPTFVQWAKNIDANDQIHLYFALYAATFGNSNYISFECKQCKSFFMTEDIPIKNMWRMDTKATDKEKKRFNDINKFGKVKDGFKSREEQYQASDDYVFLLHPISLFNTLEESYINAEFRKKYAPVLRISEFISGIYYINRERGLLKPIDLGQNPENIIKSFKSKILAVHKVIQTLNPDQYAMLSAKIFSIDERSERTNTIIKYFIPEQNCLGTYKKGDLAGKRCTHIFKEQPMNPLNMLFTRHQLAARSI